MSEPFLRIRASGMGGSGYLIPTRGEDGDSRTDPKSKALKVVGVTTALGALDKGGIPQWVADQTAAFAVANAQALAERESEWGFRYLRFYHARKPDFDDPTVNLHNYHSGVLSDLSNQGTIIHEAVEAFVKDEFGPTFTRPEQEEAFTAFLDWVEENEVEFHSSEVTVVNPLEWYAGTLDLTLTYRGRKFLVDLKTSRKVHDTHISQVAALYNANLKMVESEDGIEYKGRRWTEDAAEKCDAAAILQIRPRTVDDYGNEVPAYVRFHEIPKWELEPAYDIFKGAVRVRKAQRALKEARKEADRNGDF